MKSHTTKEYNPINRVRAGLKNSPIMLNSQMQSSSLIWNKSQFIISKSKFLSKVLTKNGIHSENDFFADMSIPNTKLRPVKQNHNVSRPLPIVYDYNRIDNIIKTNSNENADNVKVTNQRQLNKYLIRTNNNRVMDKNQFANSK